jgi:hypothetical protein
MKAIAKHLSFATLVMSLFFLRPLGAVAQEVWVDMNFDNVEAGSPPPAEKFQPGTVSHSLDSVSTTGSNQLLVIKDAPGFPGKALHFVKGSPEPRTPRAVFVNQPGLVKSGKVSFTWDAALESFTSSDKFPGFEALLSFGLMDAVGKPFFNLYYLVGPDKTTGVFGSSNQKLGSWTLGTKQQFEVTIDLDSSTAIVKIDGVEVGGPISLPTPDGLRLVQFSDGTGLAFYGSQFAATIANFKMTKL